MDSTILGFSLFRQLVSCFYGILHAGLYFGYRESETVEKLMKLFVVQSQVDQCRAFLPYQFFYFRIIVSLVFSSENNTVLVVILCKAYQQEFTLVLWSH